MAIVNVSIPIFPTPAALPGQTFPVKRTIMWNNVPQDALSGKSTRYPLYTYPRYGYDLPISVMRANASFLEWQLLEGFINIQIGSLSLFAYNEPNDNSASSQLFGEGDGSTTQFQLVRTLGGFVEPVFIPNNITQLTVGGVPTSAYTVGSTGIITFNAAPAAGSLLTWTGFFYWPCRFDKDQFEFNQFMSQLYELKSLKFTTEKLA